jgi:hypothetical protein
MSPCDKDTTRKAREDFLIIKFDPIIFSIGTSHGANAESSEITFYKV